MSDFEQSYLGQLRQLVGNRRLISPAVRAVIQDQEGRVLFIQRSDNGRWALPAGSMELHESVLDSLKREVKEETGLTVLEATLIAIYSEPRFHFTNAFGGEHQMLAFVFRVDKWEGEVCKSTDETVDASFFALDGLPYISEVHKETLEDLVAYNGQVILK